jgi:hypothetical protein
MITPAFNLTATERVLPRLALDWTTGLPQAGVDVVRAGTATFVGSNGLIQSASTNTQRIDYSNGTAGLLIEESRQNILTYSEDFANAVWTKTRSSITSNSVIAPDGALTGDKLVEDTTASASHPVASLFFAITPNATYSVSLFVQAAGRNAVVLRLNSSPDDIWCAFDLANGTVGTALNTGTGSGAVGSIKSFGNGWYRCTLTGIPSTTATSTSLVVYPAVSTNDPSFSSIVYTGDGTSGINIWGAQRELGAFPTSYIPTVATAVTRNADVATMTGTNFSDWFNASAGALYAEASQPVIFSTSKQVASLNDGTATNRIMVYRQAAGSINAIVIPSGQVFSSSGVTATANVPWKQIFAYTTTAGTYAANSVLGTNTAYAIPSALLTMMNIGAGYPSSNDFLNGHIKKIMYYPQKLTNAELVALTKL